LFDSAINARGYGVRRNNLDDLPGALISDGMAWLLIFLTVHPCFTGQMPCRRDTLEREVSRSRYCM
jgi:hypothetical protein